MPTKRQIAAGVSDNYLGFYDDYGHFIGGTPDTPTAGNGSGMVELLGMKAVAVGVPESEIVVITGDDIDLGEFEFDSVQARSYIAEMAVDNMQLDAYLLGTNIETIAGIDFGALDIANAPERNVFVVHQGRAKKYDADNRGQKAYAGVLIPLGTAKPLGRTQMREREGAVYRLRITPQLAVYNPWEVTINAGNAGTDALRQRPFRSDYPLHMMAWRGDGATATIPLDYEPVSAAYTKGWRNVHGGIKGDPLTTLSVSGAGVLPRIATLSAAPATDTYNTLLYQYRRK